ncbi:spore germination protein [Peribacillus glennii]|uniref:Spore germination protein n=1 Tax=Peribacillus glennii TaxID=2303991 RepID=A0A372LDP5_9BACI|nr:spore germination protein [Peribacillus glennii]RFU63828.1 spore germination protein [Peribacillus glennii]
MNFFKKKKKRIPPLPKNKAIPHVGDPAEDFEELFKKFKASKDFLSFQYPSEGAFTVSYFKTIVSPNQVHKEILLVLAEQQPSTLIEAKKVIPIENMKISTDLKVIQNAAMRGAVIIQLEKGNGNCLLVPCVSSEKRQISVPETEFSVVGPKEAFVESLETNVNLIRKRLPVPELQLKEIKVGKISQTRTAILYIDGIANHENVNRVCQRISELDYDTIADSSYIAQMIADNQNSAFPQFIDTERPDRAASVLSEGKVVILVDGSPHALIGPASIGEFFSAFEDYLLNWHIASGFRLIRLFAVLFSVMSTSMYVAVITYHYQSIPEDLLPTLIASRGAVPFPPILEALILEGTIELLREAGARLPTKVGQTIGIVGGIVIGTAAVQAGFVSNVLLMLVALAALASFTTPIYQISNTIRLIRFPFLIAAQLYGLLGVAICAAFFLSHLLKLTSLGRPYLEPLYPLRLQDMKDSFIRLPFSRQKKRPVNLRPEEAIRFEPKQEPKPRDIDE